MIAFRAPWTKIGVFFSACFQVTFSNDFRGLNLDFWVSKPSIWCERGCKNQLFTEVGILMILVSFFDVFYGLGVLFLSFEGIGGRAEIS